MKGANIVGMSTEIGPHSGILKKHVPEGVPRIRILIQGISQVAMPWEGRLVTEYKNMILGRHVEIVLKPFPKEDVHFAIQVDIPLNPSAEEQRAVHRSPGNWKTQGVAQHDLLK